MNVHEKYETGYFFILRSLFSANRGSQLAKIDIPTNYSKYPTKKNDTFG